MQPPVYKDLVLIGGGHSHIAVLRSFGMRPLPGVRLTLISRTTETPYSGMLPGLVAGYYTFDEAHIDLVPLCRFAGARFFRGEVVGIDVRKQTVMLADRPPVAYDILSINSGSTPSIGSLTNADGLTPVKPVDQFLPRWERILRRGRDASGPLRIAVVGAGAGGVEITLAIDARLRAEGIDAAIELISDGDDVLTTHNASVRRRLRDCLAQRQIALRLDTRITAAANGSITTAAGERHDFDEVIWTTDAAAPAWLAAAGLETDARGFLLVDDYLRSVSDPNVFGAGDAATIRTAPRPKSGVFAVRQGRPLAENLRRALLRRPLRRYRAQRRFLSLIGTSDGAAVASRGPFAWQGRWVWRWKERIDRRFMQRFQRLPAMASPTDRTMRPLPPALLDDTPISTPADGMRCGGCGAKVGATALEAALQDLRTVARDDVVVGLDAPDDAAILAIPAGKLVATSVDAFRPIVDDAYTFGRIAANHGLNDLHAMGAAPQSALAIVALPHWPEKKLIDELRQMLAGASHAFAAEGVALVGGHTSEAGEISLGFAVTGLVDPNARLAKTGLRDGDRLILTKAIGTGAIMAADMRGKARGRWVDAALESMLRSNAGAAAILAAHGAHACTDVTGFGLFGHLVEMAGRPGASIRLAPDSIPVLAGALDVVGLGIVSTMQPKNEQLRERAECSDALARHPVFALLFDPQTAGGLLGAVPEDTAPACLDALRQAGYRASAIIGSVLAAHAQGKLELGT